MFPEDEGTAPGNARNTQKKCLIPPPPLFEERDMAPPWPKTLSLAFTALVLAWTTATPSLADEAELRDVVRMVTEVMPGGKLTFADQKLSEAPCWEAAGFLFKDISAYVRYVTRTGSGLRKVIPEKEAEELFRFLENQPDIPFHFPEDGCYMRAHEMSRILEVNGIYSQKLFIFGKLYAEAPWAPTGWAKWDFHVAPVISVETPEGKLEQRVLDPSLFDHPVPVEEWQRKQTNQVCAETQPVAWNPHNNVCYYYRTERFTYLPTEALDHPESWLPKDQKDSETLLRDYGERSRKRTERRKKILEGN